MDIKFEKDREYTKKFETKELLRLPLSGTNLQQLFRYADEYIAKKAVMMMMMRYRDTGTR